MTAARSAPAAVRRVLLGAAFLLLAAALLWRLGVFASDSPVPVRLALVLPDGLPADSAHAQAWLDAAAETGFPMQVVRASELLQPGRHRNDMALVLPDTVHRAMNDALVTEIEERVQAGAALMLVHDAGVLGVDDRFASRRSRLSGLAGVDYALYDELRADTVRSQVVQADPAALALLQLPPGKLMRLPDAPPAAGGAAPAERLAIASYRYGPQHYPVYLTRGRFDGQRLLYADGDVLVAGLHRVGAGTVLFANLPLGELKLRTDGMLMHGLLRLFAQDVVKLPQLSPMPRARGELVLNWHIDSSAAMPAMDALQTLGAFEQGPFSFHLTAGPDLDRPGDGLGMDLLRNPRMRDWVQHFVERGDAVGSHGGWIHNAFGREVGRQDHALSVTLIERNVLAVSATSGQPVREYSAPLGNHPAWITSWLHERGVVAYYFTGDIGMAPTRSYQDGVPAPAGIWSFPLLSSGLQAGFEESHAAGVSEDDMAAWLKAVSDYCAEKRTLRLLYFHPPGVDRYPNAFRSWFAHNAALARAGTLRWTTMAAYADFANERLRARWEIDDDGSAQHLRASHPRSLDTLSWLLPADRYARPQVLAGNARVDLDGGYWRVVAGASPALEIFLPLRPAPAGASSTASFAGQP